MRPTFPNSPYNRYYHYYNNRIRNSNYFKPEEYFHEEVQDNLVEPFEREKSSNLTEYTRTQKNKSSGFNFNFLNFENIFSGNSDEPIFEILGIKLYLDDLLILGLLFILYNEGVKDEMLFIALVLLLIG